MTKLEEVLEQWTTLKEKLTKLITINQHQPLIKEALEFHLNQASFLLSDYFLHETRTRLNIPSDWTITELTEPTCSQHNSDGTINQEWRTYFTKREWNAYLSQQQKNEGIVRETKELLRILEN